MSNEPNPLSYASEPQLPAWRKQERRQWLIWLLSHVWHFFMGIMLLAAAVGLVAFMMGTPAAAWLVGAALIIASIGSATIRTQRRYRAYRIFSYLQQAIRCHLPLPPMLAAAAQSESGVLRSRLNRLNFALHDGASIADAVAFAIPEASDRHVSLLYASARNGDLPRTLEQLVNEHHAITHYRTMHNAFMRVYFVLVIAGIGFTGWLLAIFVMPKFQQIMRDFGVRAPWAMRKFLEFSPVSLFLLAVLGYMMLMWLIGVIGRETFSNRTRRWSPVRTILDHLTWYLPVIGSQQRDRGLGDVFEVLATATENHRPLSAAAIEASNLHLNRVLQDRMMRFADSITGGISLGDAAHGAKLPSLASGLLGAAEKAGNLPETLRFLATYYNSRFSKTAAILQAAALPAMAIVMGAIVLFIALAIIMPIVTLVSVTDPWGKIL